MDTNIINTTMGPSNPRTAPTQPCQPRTSANQGIPPQVAASPHPLLWWGEEEDLRANSPYLRDSKSTPIQPAAYPTASPLPRAQWPGCPWTRSPDRGRHTRQEEDGHRSETKSVRSPSLKVTSVKI